MQDDLEFAFPLDKSLTNDCCICTRKVYKWEYITPPKWITDKLNESQLQQEIEHINKLSNQKTTKTSSYFYFGPIILS